jgi:3-methyl-2-oxobutanoate hydroxymethyltransferase
MAVLTLDEIRARKGKEKIVCLTAYTTPMASMLAPHVDLLLVGDSVGMVLYGMDSTQGVNIPMMIAHGKAVMRGAYDTPVIVDMPYGSYEGSDNDALRSASLIMEETGCAGVKLEGGKAMASRIACLTEHDIPVMAHIGLLPQSAPDEGGYKIKGKTPEEVQRLIDDARAVEEAGAFAVVIEGTIETVAAHLSAAITIPTIGIGASGACDGQILVSEDMLGLSGMRLPKFVKPYATLESDIEKAVKAYADEVRAGVFPGKQYVY